ncbi:hypothetical protein [Sorangium sp. So ce1389]|uniref:hypothetical protein n=1 Tax=Sorangium sp. So ce1389 TaxID=3133336 RepID=UPI003F5EB92D
MISIHGKVMGLAMVVAALGTGCAVDAADADFDQAGLDEAAELDSTAAALEEAAEEERGGYQAQAPTKDMFGPSKGAPSKGVPGKGAPGKGMLGLQAPVGQLGQAPVGQLGQAPVGQLGQAPIGQLGQAPIGQLGQEPVGQLGQAPIGAPGQSARNFGFGCPVFGGGFPGFFGGGFPFNINNNNNINVVSILDKLLNRDHCPHHCSGSLWGSC